MRGAFFGGLVTLAIAAIPNGGTAQDRAPAVSDAVAAALQHIPAEQRWRYRWHEGHWFYWPPSGQQWLVWIDGEWKPAGRPPAREQQRTLFDTPNGLRGYSQHYTYRVGPAGPGYYGNPAANTSRLPAENVADNDPDLERETSGEGYRSVAPLDSTRNGIGLGTLGGRFSDSLRPGPGTPSRAGQAASPSLGGFGGIGSGAGDLRGGIGSGLGGTTTNPFGANTPSGSPGTGGLGVPTTGTPGPSSPTGGSGTGTGTPGTP